MAEQHVIPHLGPVPLRELAPAHIRTWHRTMLDKPRAWGCGTLSTTTELLRLALTKLVEIVGETAKRRPRRREGLARRP